MARVGVTGMGTMGAALALNIADNGFDVAVHNRSPEKMHDVVATAGELAPRLKGAETLEDFVASIEAPRAILIMVQAHVLLTHHPLHLPMNRNLWLRLQYRGSFLPSYPNSRLYKRRSQEELFN